MLATLIIGDPAWVGPAVAAAVVGGVLVLLAYLRVRSNRSLLVPALLKVTGLALLAACLLEPLWSSTRARPGANQFVVLVDNSRSLTVRDHGADQTRADAIAAVLREESVSPDAWHVRLQQDFDVRRYVAAARLNRVPDYESLEFDGTASALNTALQSIAQRYRDRPLAGILLVSDGNVTDLQDGQMQTADLPPVYPLVVGSAAGLHDLRIDSFSVRETPFEDAPVTIAATARSLTSGHGPVVAELIDEAGEVVETATHLAAEEDGSAFAFRFQVRPPKPGVAFYTLQVTAEAEGEREEATLDNNERIVCINRDHRPRRLLYVSGRPNWEFKFLRRALEGDPQLDLVGLIRIARREAKFDFRGRDSQSSNALFKGFKEESDEETEEYDQPVLVRLNTKDEVELREGFPKSAEDLFAFDAVIIDDIEAKFFTADQQDLIDRFVAKRGGGLLMLGGQESFRNGGYDRTPVGRMLPVYLDRPADIPPESGFRFRLTREGRLQPWMRLRENWEDEQARLRTLPEFRTVNRVSTIKPGAMVLASVSAAGHEIPAIVTHSFGRGKVAAVTIGDLWRWRLQEDHSGPRATATDDSDQATAWRQLLRWLVVDVPQRVNTDVGPADDVGPGALRLVTQARDARFEPVENAAVTVQIETPGGETMELEAEAGAQAGVYEAVYVPRVGGAYRASVRTVGPDGVELGIVKVGWASDPTRQEFASVAPNVELMRTLAAETGGEIVPLQGLDQFVAELPSKEVPITEQWTWPLWHQSWVFLLAMGCLVGEWGLRRVRGLP